MREEPEYFYQTSAELEQHCLGVNDRVVKQISCQA